MFRPQAEKRPHLYPRPSANVAPRHPIELEIVNEDEVIIYTDFEEVEKPERIELYQNEIEIGLQGVGEYSELVARGLITAIFFIMEVIIKSFLYAIQYSVIGFVCISGAIVDQLRAGARQRKKMKRKENNETNGRGNVTVNVNVNVHN